MMKLLIQNALTLRKNYPVYETIT